MGIIHQKDRCSGITYAYESISYWDKEKHQSRVHRRLIGRVSESGEVVPADGRCSRKPDAVKRTRRRGPVPVTQVQRSFYGATWLLDQIGEKLGIVGDLRACFPDDYRRLLSIVYYLILGGNRAMMYFKYWALNHTHPCGEDISSQDSSKIGRAHV